MRLHLHLLQRRLHLDAGAEGSAGPARPLRLALDHGLNLVVSTQAQALAPSLVGAARVAAGPSLWRRRGPDVNEKKQQLVAVNFT